MKKVLLPLVMLCLLAPFAFAANHGSSHPGSHAPRSHTSTPHHSQHHPKTSIPHERRHVTSVERNALFERAGIPRSERHNYIVDHRIPLELGGSNALSNLQVQPKTLAHRKDKVENCLAGKVRRGEMSLSEAQSEVRHWETVDTSH